MLPTAAASSSASLPFIYWSQAQLEDGDCQPFIKGVVNKYQKTPAARKLNNTAANRLRVFLPSPLNPTSIRTVLEFLKCRDPQVKDKVLTAWVQTFNVSNASQYTYFTSLMRVMRSFDYEMYRIHISDSDPIEKAKAALFKDEVNLLTDKDYRCTRDALDFMMKKAAADGKYNGYTKKDRDPMSARDIQRAIVEIAAKYKETRDPRLLQYLVAMTLLLTCAERGAEELEKIRGSDFHHTIVELDNGDKIKAWAFGRGTSKTSQGGLEDHRHPAKEKFIYEDSSADTPEKKAIDPYTILTEYLNARSRSNDDFWQQCRDKFDVVGCGYKNQRLSGRSVNNFMNRVQAVLGWNKKWTNHMVRGATATGLAMRGCTALELSEVTQHRCADSVKNYLRPSHSRKLEMQRITNGVSDSRRRKRDLATMTSTDSSEPKAVSSTETKAVSSSETKTASTIVDKSMTATKSGVTNITIHNYGVSNSLLEKLSTMYRSPMEELNPEPFTGHLPENPWLAGSKPMAVASSATASPMPSYPMLSPLPDLDMCASMPLPPMIESRPPSFNMQPIGSSAPQVSDTSALPPTEWKLPEIPNFVLDASEDTNEKADD